MKTDMSFLLSINTSEIVELKKEISKITIEEIFEDIEMIKDDYDTDLFQSDELVTERITDEEPMGTVFLTTLGIGVLQKLIVEVIKKTPQAIKALKKLIKKILEKSQNKTKGTETPIFELYYKGLIIEITEPTEKHIDAVLEKLIPALGG